MNVLARVSGPGGYQSFHVAADGTIIEPFTALQSLERLFVPMILAVLLPIASMFGAGAMARSFTEDNETRMIEMLVTSAPTFSVMAGKLAALVATGLVYIALWITVATFAIAAISGWMTGGVLVFNMSPGLLVTVLVTSVLGYSLFTTLGLLVGTLASSPVTAQRRMSILALFAALPLANLIIDFPDAVLPYIPLTAPYALMLRLAREDVSYGETAAILAFVAATGLVALWTGARIFRARILLSGQRKTLGNVWTALRRAG